MAQTKVIIIYSPNQNVRRATIVPHDDADIEIHVNNITKGEAVLIGEKLDYDTIGPDAMLSAYTKQQPSSDLCVVVDSNGNVCCGIKADPLIDSHPDGEIHQHEKACVGWKKIADQWISPEPDPIKIPPLDITFYPETLTTVVPRDLWNSLWSIQYNHDNITIGCETHTIDEWNSFKDSRIALMDVTSLQWWQQYKSLVMSTAAVHLSNCGLVS
jgi:hypothetical protein